MKIHRINPWAFWSCWLCAAWQFHWGHSSPGAQADYVTAAYMVGVAVLAYFAATQLIKRAGTTKQKIDNTPTTLSARGFRLQRVIGRRPVGGYFVWAGNRFTTEESSGGGSGKGGGGSAGGSTQTIYWEEAIVLLATGPLDRLHQITQAGEVIWTGPIDRFNTPSGTEIAVSDGSSFVIWWGEEDQPLDTWAGEATRLEVVSRWPFFARVSWKPKKLGPNRTWQELKYFCEGSVAGSELARSPQFFQETDATTHNDGPNPAHIIYSIVTAPHPHGAGQPPERWDFGKLEDLGELLQREQFPLSILVDPVNGPGTVSEILADMAGVIGFLMPQVGDVVVFEPIRYVDPADIPVFDATMIAAPNPEREFAQGSSAIDKTTFFYLDRNSKFTRVPVDMQDDAEAYRYNRRKSIETDLPGVIDGTTARRVANRRELESFAGGSKYQFDMNYTARELTPGKAFSVTGFGTFRVGTIKMRLDSQLVRVVAAFDQYSLNAMGWDPGSGNLSGVGGTPAVDLSDGIFELPYSFVGSTEALGFARIRSNIATGPASVWLSLDGTSYQQVGVQSGYATGGILLQDIASNAPAVVEQGPTILAQGPDIATALDLSGERSSWFGGRQVALIGQELFLVRNTTAVTGGWRLDGLIHGRGGTVAENHAAGSRVYLFEAARISAIAGAQVTAGRTLFFKVQPTGIALADCPALPFTTAGRALAPLPVDSIRQVQPWTLSDAITAVTSDYFEFAGENRSRHGRGRLVRVLGNADPATDGFYVVRHVTITGGNTRVYVRGTIPAGATASGSLYPAQARTAYVAGDDINLSWLYRNRDGGGLTAGDQPFGSAVPLGDDGLVLRRPREGSFIVEARTSAGVLKKSWTIATDSVYPWWTSGPWTAPIVYTQADRTTDFGSSDPVIEFRIRCVAGAYASPWRYQTFTVE